MKENYLKNAIKSIRRDKTSNRATEISKEEAEVSAALAMLEDIADDENITPDEKASIRDAVNKVKAQIKRKFAQTQQKALNQVNSTSDTSEEELDKSAEDIKDMKDQMMRVEDIEDLISESEQRIKKIEFILERDLSSGIEKEDEPTSDDSESRQTDSESSEVEKDEDSSESGDEGGEVEQPDSEDPHADKRTCDFDDIARKIISGNKEQLHSTLKHSRLSGVKKLLEILQSEEYEVFRSLSDFKAFKTLKIEDEDLYKKCLNYLTKVNEIYKGSILRLHPSDRRTELDPNALRRTIASLLRVVQPNNNTLRAMPIEAIEQAIETNKVFDCGFGFLYELYYKLIPFRFGDYEVTKDDSDNQESEEVPELGVSEDAEEDRVDDKIEDAILDEEKIGLETIDNPEEFIRSFLKEPYVIKIMEEAPEQASFIIQNKLARTLADKANQVSEEDIFDLKEDFNLNIAYLNQDDVDFINKYSEENNIEDSQSILAAIVANIDKAEDAGQVVTSELKQEIIKSTLKRESEKKDNAE